MPFANDRALLAAFLRSLAIATEDGSLLLPKPDEEAGDRASPAAGPFASALDECLAIVARIRDTLENHQDVSPDKVTWGQAADAGHILQYLRHAAFVAGVGDEPAE